MLRKEASSDQRAWADLFGRLRQAIHERLDHSDPLSGEELAQLADAASTALYGQKMAKCFDAWVKRAGVSPPE